MAVRIRNTEKHPHPFWDRLVREYPVPELQGFVFSATDQKLLDLVKQPGDERIPIQCIEAIEYDKLTDLEPANIFSTRDWELKIRAAAFFGSTLLLLTHCPGSDVLIQSYEVSIVDDKVTLTPKHTFADEAAFINWWSGIKILSQTKALVEAVPRQAETMFDAMIERNGYSWGGNMDGFILSEDLDKLEFILEIRQSHWQALTEYAPPKYFKGTAKKGGDFKTWLPLVYLQKNYDLPIVLITLSAKDQSAFGFTEVVGINNNRLFYVDDIAPGANVTDSFEVFDNWLKQLIRRRRNG